MPLNILALDIGAESGRAILGRLNDGRLELKEIHRFPNGPVRLPTGLHWDALGLFNEIKTGLHLANEEIASERSAGRRRAVKLASIGLDTWGVDFGLLDARGELLGDPYHYRDVRTDGMVEKAWSMAGRDTIFEATGIQFMQLNTLYQLLALKQAKSPALKVARTLLTMPDLFNYWLTGKKVSEFSIATTTQCYDPRAHDWAFSLLEQLGIPGQIFPEVVPPGTVLGGLLPWIAEETGLKGVKVIAPACHDTGCAVAAVPAAGRGFAYLSSGTWSLLGAELTEPVINAETLALNVTNEGGVGGTIRFLKNIIGLWIVQQCRHTWRLQGEDLSYDDITWMAAEAEPFRSLIDPDWPEFLPHGDMPARIAEFCRKFGPAHTGNQRPVYTLRPGEPGSQIPQDPGEPGRRAGTPSGPAAYRRRRHQEQAAQPVRRQRHRPPGDCRPGRGNRNRQYSGAGRGPGRVEFAGRGARRGAQFIRGDAIRTRRNRPLG